MKFWFTADLHLGHANIIKLCNRPFKDINHMNEVLIKNWNSRVAHEDVIFHLGDFCYKSGFDPKNYINRLNGQIIFLKGNHDGNNNLKAIINDLTITYGGKQLLLVHDPETVSCVTELVLCGHVHENWKFKSYITFDACNVGVDVWKFYPINIEEILREYDKWKKEKKEKV